MFKLQSSYKPTGDQPQAIEALVNNLRSGADHQVLLGVTGSGKTFTMANVIAAVQKPTLIISHNKTLAAQLYQEFKDYFPDNAVSYFVSYYDYYQPEAYIPQTDTYIEKETDINEEIDKLRLAATTNLLTRKDVIVVASVSCIYNLGSPVQYQKNILPLAVNQPITRRDLLSRLNTLQYTRSDFDFKRSSFRIRGESIDIYPAYEDTGIRLTHDGEKIISINKFHILTGNVIPEKKGPPLESRGGAGGVTIYPAKHNVTDPGIQKDAFDLIHSDLETQVKLLKSQNKLLEAHRLSQRVNYDLEMIQAVGYVNGIENYSRYFDGRSPGDPPYSLLDYFSYHPSPKMRRGAGGEVGAEKDYLLIIDESHISVPQIRGMYHGDRSRKQTLIDFGFRLPSALDNRPLKFDEFLRRMGKTIYTSATPDEWEISQSQPFVIEQLIRPTGLVDPQIIIRPAAGQITDLISEITLRTAKKQRVLVTTLTKRMAEDLTAYLEEKGLKVQYLHSDIDTLKRLDVLSDLRSGNCDVVVGINLLREGLDLPEVSLVAILDADKEGFLRSKTALIQTMGRASRHLEGTVIMYADTVTRSMQAAIAEVNRRRQIQIDYNLKYHIIPVSITKPIRDRIVEMSPENPLKIDMSDINQLIPEDLTKLLKMLRRQMLTAAKNLDFELAALLRDKITKIRPYEKL